MAGGCWTSKLIVRDLPSTHRQAYDQFYRSPCMMANVALRNWRFLTNWGSQAASGSKDWADSRDPERTNIFHGQENHWAGFASGSHAEGSFSHYGKTLQEQGNLGRAELSTSFSIMSVRSARNLPKCSPPPIDPARDIVRNRPQSLGTRLRQPAA
jgi:spermidine dehydrogenase